MPVAATEPLAAFGAAPEAGPVPATRAQNGSCDSRVSATALASAPSAPGHAVAAATAAAPMASSWPACLVLRLCAGIDGQGKRYIISGEKLGQGTFGVVYLGHLANGSQQELAMKVLKGARALQHHA